MGIRDQFFCHFGPPNRSKLRSLFIFRKGPTGFGLVNLRYVWGGVEYRPQGPNLRVILGPWNRSFRSSVTFSKSIHWFRIISVYMLIGNIFRCVLVKCPKGPISGPRNKVAAEHVRASGLLVKHISTKNSTITRRKNFNTKWEMVHKFHDQVIVWNKITVNSRSISFIWHAKAERNWDGKIIPNRMF